MDNTLGEQDQPFRQDNKVMQHCSNAREIKESYPHQNAPLEQLLELSQAYQAHALCVFGCLLLCLCAVTPAQPGSNNMCCTAIMLSCYAVKLADQRGADQWTVMLKCMEGCLCMEANCKRQQPP